MGWLIGYLASSAMLRWWITLLQNSKLFCMCWALCWKGDFLKVKLKGDSSGYCVLCYSLITSFLPYILRQLECLCGGIDSVLSNMSIGRETNIFAYYMRFFFFGIGLISFIYLSSALEGIRHHLFANVVGVVFRNVFFNTNNFF